MKSVRPTYHFKKFYDYVSLSLGLGKYSLVGAFFNLFPRNFLALSIVTDAGKGQ